MASWKEERDRLVAQTLAFVQQVAAAHPAAATKLGLGSATAPAGREASLVPSLAHADDAIAATPGEQAAEVASSAQSVDPLSMPTNILADLPDRPTQYSKISERSDISQRVAAFKARQVTLNRERQAYYDSVQARIRSSLGNDTSADRL